jgi:hypothetical protein
MTIQYVISVVVVSSGNKFHVLSGGGTTDATNVTGEGVLQVELSGAASGAVVDSRHR